jgi:hypothetical protein
VDSHGKLIKFPRSGETMYRSAMPSNDELFVYELDDVPKEEDPVTVFVTQFFK